MIELTSFSKQYGRHRAAVRNVSLRAEAGSVSCLLGPNGAGKTTIIKAVCALHYATDGCVRVSGRDGRLYDAQEHPEIVRDAVGYVPEAARLPGELTAAEFLDFCADVHGLSGAERRKALERAAGFCALESVLEKKIRTLSNGFRQRVSFAQAVLHDPPNLVLDEPVNGLDPAQMVQLRSLIRRAAADKAVLLSTHLMQEVQALAGTIFILSNGTVAASGTADEIMQAQGAASLEEAFLSAAGGRNELSL
ncbi:MAG: ABC transporter ATP-binding protein [Treponemataceae bacterium]|nr:ABC transporter ATP-binding protein [Treponemataceae bacterium]